MGAWTGSGPIVTGSCSTAAWTLFDLSTAYLWAPVIGCLPEKPDCCPSSYVLATMTAPPSPGMTTDSISISLSTTLTSNTTSIATAGSSTTAPETTRFDLIHIAWEPGVPNASGLGAFKLAARGGGTPNSVSGCPEDYVSNGPTGCCPMGMTATKDLGIIPVCATQLSAPFPAPEVTITASSPHQPTGLPTDKPISTATDMIYAIQYRIYALEYPTAPKAESGGLSTGAKAGIGAGCGFIALVLIGLVVYFIRRKGQRKRKQETDGTAVMGTMAESELYGRQYDPATGEKAESKPLVVGERAELGVEGVQGHGLQRYELSATPLPPSQVYQVIQVPSGQQPQQYQQQQPYGGYQL
ncbi:hypothetical protein QBC37DRAFT_466648 [Rhypophila decipiens]|uniref:Uncharacterized protein n=1 Tax=Rhypophila decipiens TaxID=261697 RepID=A0AAN6Y9L9_9PEZI|nr:hypothetical protein QBC37DRAFT_466648 [Rhypophila decipiens]